jgi:hypothetical protein
MVMGPTDSDLRMTVLAIPAAIVSDKPILSSERMLHEGFDRKGSVEIKLFVVFLKGLVPKTN